MAALAWNESTWSNNEGFGGITHVSVTLTGLGAATGLGTATSSVSIDAVVSGVSASGSVGQVFALQPATWGALTWGTPRGWSGNISVEVAATGLQASGSLGALSSVTNNSIPATGLVATAALSTGVEVSAGADHPVSGVSASMAVGTVAITAEVEVSPVGVQATATPSTVTFVTTNFVPITNVLGSTTVGTVTINGKASVTLIGVSAVGAVTSPLVWQVIDDTQSPNWLLIAA